MPTQNEKIKSIRALEILDSRGVPTLQVSVYLTDGTVGVASVPSGTSSGTYEAHELRDHDDKRYHGKGVISAVRMVEDRIGPALKGKNILDHPELDRIVRSLDPDSQKSTLGSNSVLGVSLATARAGAIHSKLPLYRYIREAYNLQLTTYNLPQPMFNLLNGGAHAESGMDIQEFMLVPRAPSFAESVRWAAETFVELAVILRSRGMETGVGLEGGFAPKLRDSREALTVLLEAASRASLPPESVGIGLDVAASELKSDSDHTKYLFKRENLSFSREQLISWYQELIGAFPIISIEDGLDENDWVGWRTLFTKLGESILVVGDDLTVTNTARLQIALDTGAVNALIIKPNQVGTLSETIETVRLALENNIKLIVSHRSGDTPDSFIADLAVAINADFIKAGSVTRGERVAKANRLMEIEQEITN